MSDDSSHLTWYDDLPVREIHLVVHDVGGPVGFELAAEVPDRVKSLTVLNSGEEAVTRAEW